MNQSIFRIQDQNGEGIYRGRYVRVEDYVCDISRHPTPNRDSKLKETAAHLFDESGDFEGIDFIFGFESIVQLRAWFYNDEIFSYLNDEGFVLVEMVGEIYHGNCQSIIDGSTAEIVKTFSLLEIPS